VTWDEALSYADIINDVASEWAFRCKDASIKDDLIQTLYVDLVAKVKTDNARDKIAYVRGACWKRAEKFVNSKKFGIPRDKVSLDMLETRGWQIDEDRIVRKPDRFRLGHLDESALDNPTDCYDE
jgi:hypothetical protein